MKSDIIIREDIMRVATFLRRDSSLETEVPLICRLMRVVAVVFVASSSETLAEESRRKLA